VSLHHQSASPARQPKKKGCWKLVIVDDTGAVNVIPKQDVMTDFDIAR
jgi:hypothetical protein